MSIADEERKIYRAMSALEHQCYQKGLKEGLKIADQIRNYLTQQPDTKRQKQAREWADKLISKFTKEGR